MDIHEPPNRRPPPATSGTRARIDPGSSSSSHERPPARQSGTRADGMPLEVELAGFSDPSLLDPALMGVPLALRPTPRKEKPFHQPPPEPTGLHHGIGGGRNASLYYARRKIERDHERDRLYQINHTPKAVEAAMKRQRERPYRRTFTNSLPSPMMHVGRFLADPQKRFWLGCNIFCVVMLFGSSVLFLLFLYPTLLRPIVKY